MEVATALKMPKSAILLTFYANELTLSENEKFFLIANNQTIGKLQVTYQYF